MLSGSSFRRLLAAGTRPLRAPQPQQGERQHSSPRGRLRSAPKKEGGIGDNFQTDLENPNKLPPSLPASFGHQGEPPSGGDSPHPPSRGTSSTTSPNTSRRSGKSLVRRASVSLFRAATRSKEFHFDDIEDGEDTPKHPFGGGHHHHHDHHHERLLWRDIYSVTADPDQPTFLRLKLLEDAGFGKAAGVHFDFAGQKGIVLYIAKSVTSEDILNARENISYMKAAAQLVGASVALSKPKKAAEELAEELKKDLCDGEDDGDDDDDDDDDSSEDGGGALRHYIKSYAKKLKGGKLQPPPPMPQNESILTFFGAFITLLLLAFTSKSIKEATDKDYMIVLGPFGALMTLQYGLVMAPASQPRNALYGQTIALGIAQLFTYIPEASLPLWVRVPLATACSIASMTRLGITHPPAGAAALIISSGGFDWMILPLMLLGNVIALITATFFNNLSDKRQYPTYLKFGISDLIKGLLPFFCCCFFLDSRGEDSEDDDDNVLPVDGDEEDKPLNGFDLSVNAVMSNMNKDESEDKRDLSTKVSIHLETAPLSEEASMATSTMPDDPDV